jgi:hypothetical protein
LSSSSWDDCFFAPHDSLSLSTSWPLLPIIYLGKITCSSPFFRHSTKYCVLFLLLIDVDFMLKCSTLVHLLFGTIFGVTWIFVMGSFSSVSWWDSIDLAATLHGQKK